MASVVTEKLVVGQPGELQPPAEAPKKYPPVDLKAGDRVRLEGKVVAVDGDVVTVETEPCDLPGSDGYRMRVTLHGLQVKKV